MKVISDRGVFRPIIVIDGQVAGIWKRSFEKQAVRVQIQPFHPLEAPELDLITHAAAGFAHFVGKSLELE